MLLLVLHCSAARGDTCVNSTQYGIKQITIGASHALALGCNGTVYAWGSNQHGQLGIDMESSDDPVPVLEHLSDLLMQGEMIIQVSAGFWHSAVVLNRGNIITWGSNSDGQLGTNSTGKPKRVFPDSFTHSLNYVQVSAGAYHTVILNSVGSVFTCGNNDYGQLGRNRTQLDVFGNVEGLPSVKQVSAGLNFTLALTSDGDLYSWGNNDHGQLGTTVDTPWVATPQKGP